MAAFDPHAPPLSVFSDGHHGKGEDFVLSSGRDYALVWKDEYEIPPNWRQYHNKRMVLNKEGQWVQEERAMPDHDHPSTQVICIITSTE